MKRVCILMFLFVGIVTAKAYDFKVDGIYYNILSLSDRTVEVTHQTIIDVLGSDNPSDYTGDIVIPESVEFNGNIFKVIAIDEAAFAFSSITSIEIPSSVKTIARRAFLSVVMDKFVIPNTVESIASIPEILDELIIEDLNDSDLPYSNVLEGPLSMSDLVSPRWKYIYVGRSYRGGSYVDGATNNSTIRYGHYIPDDQIIRDLNRIGEYNNKVITFILTYPIPPIVEKEFSKYTYMKAHIRVPKSSLKYYKEDPIWSNFFDLQGY